MPRIYAKVSVEMWGDKKFCALSGFEPSGKALWVYLLTGKFRTSIPGLNIDVGVGALSDRLGWSTDDVKRCWDEISTKEMGFADWAAGVIWLPNGIDHNEPESPNVIKGWGKVIIPECDLTRRALRSLERWLSGNKSKAFTKAFQETFGKATRNQEQEQEQDPSPLPPAGAGGVVQIRREDKKFAEQLLKANNGYCPHKTEKCADQGSCRTRIEREHAAQRRAS